MPEWEWESKTKRFRDRQTGRFLGERKVIEMRDEYVAHRQSGMRRFVETTLGGIDPDDAQAWRTGVGRLSSLGWRRIENTLITEYVYGRGGINAMTAADRTILKGMLDTQRRYWRGFMREIRSTPQSVERIAARSNLYHGASRSMYERGRASAWKLSLPEYPGEQACLGNCGCAWRISRSGDEIHAYWRRGKGDSCSDCIDNERQYSPLIFPISDEEEAA